MGAQNLPTIVSAAIVAGVCAMIIRIRLHRARAKRANPISSSTIIPELRPCTCIIKLGGSACTVKDSFETYNFKQVSDFAGQLVSVKSSKEEFRPILLHGAGSFGHFQAKQYSVAAGLLSESGQPDTPLEVISDFLREGFARARLSVTTLNQHIITTLVDQGLRPVTVSPFPLVRTKDRQIHDGDWTVCFIRNLTDILRLGFLPVMHGDACFEDGDRVTTILSGDNIFVYLCGVYRPEYAVFLTDVDGVLTGPPTSVPGPDIIADILVDDDGNWVNEQSVVTTQAAHDVTGGMRQKVKAAIEVASKFHIPVYVAKAGTMSAEMAIRGVRPEVGTCVRYCKR